MMILKMLMLFVVNMVIIGVSGTLFKVDTLVASAAFQVGLLIGILMLALNIALLRSMDKE